MKIIFDYNRTLFDPETDTLFAGAFELLQSLSKTHNLFLVSRPESNRETRLQELGVKGFFKDIYFVTEKTPEVFMTISSDPKETIIVGDNIKDEIRIGNMLRCITVWVRQGKFAGQVLVSSEEKSDYVIQEISDLKKILEQYEK